MSKKKRKDLPQVKTKEPDELKLTQTATYRQGPLPPAEELIKYNSAYPDAAKIILEAFKEQVNTRCYIEEESLDTNIYLAKRGLWLGFLIALLFLGAGVFLTIKNHEYIGGGIIATIITLVAIFVLRKKEPTKNMQKK